jgi:signal peptidase I
MIKCPSCGFNNPDSRDRCLKCSTGLKQSDVPSAEHLADKKGQRDSPVTALRNTLYRFRARLPHGLPQGVGHRFPWSAAYLSLVLGAGQAYNHQYIKALIFAVIQIFWFAFFIYTMFQWWNDFVLIGFIFWHLYAMSDGFSIAVRLNGDDWRWRQLLAVWFAMMFSFSLIFFILNFFGQGFIYTVTVKSTGLDPVFKPGDKIFVLARPFRSWMTQKGSVVFYNAPPFEITQDTGLSTNIYSVNEQSSLGVVTAWEGDVMSWKGDGEPIWVNGTPVAPNQLPINPFGIAHSIEERVPKDHVGILFTHRVVEKGVLSFLGGAFGASLPNPNDAMKGGFGVQNYSNAINVPRKDVWGVVLFRYYPPERREWYGTSGGVWEEAPAGYARE